MVRAASFVLILAFMTLAAASLVARSPQRELVARRYFSEDEVTRGQRLSLERRALFWLASLIELALLLWLASPAVAARLGSLAARWTGERWLLSVLAVGAVCFALQVVLAFPLRLYGGLYHLRVWGLTERSFGSWLADYGKGLGLSAVIGAALLLLLFAAIRLFPRAWWALAAGGSVLLGIVFAYVFPIVVAPLFNRFVPLARTPHADLLPQIETMTRAAGLPAHEVLVMDASRQGRHTNAYFAGFGSTRRIVLYDTLLEGHTPEEILSILAHEMGHWRHHHIAKGIALGGLGAFVGFYALSLLLRWAAASGYAGFQRPDEPGAIPLILLAAFVGSFVTMPVQGWVSRAFERQADRAALTLGGAPEVFIAAEKRLVRTNISNPAPSDLSVFLFATHPPAVERIAMAESAATAP